MKELKKIGTDSIEYGDKRFDLKVDKSLVTKTALNDIPLLWKKDNKYIPVTAINRTLLEERHIDALVYSPNSVYEEIMLELVKSKAHHIFNISHMISLLEKYAPEYDKRYWSRELKFGLDQWNNIRNLKDYEISWVNFFLSKNVPLKRILHFSDEKLRYTISPLLDLNPGINILESIATLLKEVGHREKTAYSNIWDDLDVNSIMNNKELTSSNKLQVIRKNLYELRYPTIAKFRERMNEHMTNIPRSAGIDLRSDENFETPGMRLQADLRSKADIKELQKWLETQKPHLEKIIDIQKGNEGNG